MAQNSEFSNNSEKPSSMHLVSLLHKLTGKKACILTSMETQLIGIYRSFSITANLSQQDKAQVAYKSGPPSARQRTPIKMVFRCQANGGPALYAGWQVNTVLTD